MVQLRLRDWQVVGRLLADIGQWFGVFVLLVGLLALATGDLPGVVSFMGLGLSVGLLSFCVRRRRMEDGVSSRHAVFALALAWPVLSLLSVVPFVAGGMEWIDAAYESFSAWTDTGLTMVRDPSTLPVALGTFRIVIQWFSGLGIVMFMLSLRVSSARAAYSFFQAEGRPEAFSTDLWTIGRTVVRIYCAYTLLGFLALWVSGLSPYEALAHAITSLSTGGFSTNPVGVGVYGAVPTAVAMVLMLAGGISFASHRELVTGGWQKFWHDPEVRLLLILIVVASGLVMTQAALIGFRELGVQDGVFYVVTAITTCGAGTLPPLSDVPPSIQFTLLLLMVSGATFGSTTGALKLWRLLVMAQVVAREVRRPLYPERAVLPLRVRGITLSDSTAATVLGYVALYLTLGIVGSLVFTLFGYSPLEALFVVFSAQGNVGLNILPDARYFSMPALLKGQLIVHMLLGRVEILPFLSLLYSIRRRSR